jgi:hypothetical protein
MLWQTQTIVWGLPSADLQSDRLLSSFSFATCKGNHLISMNKVHGSSSLSYVWNTVGGQ